MISAPILLDGKVIVSFKSPGKAQCGQCRPDFTADDLGKILALCRPLGKLLQHVASE